MENFTCPICGNKIPFNEVFKFKKDHQTKCFQCNTNLKPKNVKSWNWGFFMGFLAVIIPARIFFIYHKNFFIGASIGIVCGMIAIFLIAYYTYKTTDFEKS